MTNKQFNTQCLNKRKYLKLPRYRHMPFRVHQNQRVSRNSEASAVQTPTLNRRELSSLFKVRTRNNYQEVEVRAYKRLYNHIENHHSQGKCYATSASSRLMQNTKLNAIGTALFSTGTYYLKTQNLPKVTADLWWSKRLHVGDLIFIFQKNKHFLFSACPSLWYHGHATPLLLY